MKRSCFTFPRLPLALLTGLSAMVLAAGAPAWAHSDESLCALPPDMPVRDSQVRTLDGKALALPGTAPTLVLFWSVFNPIPLPDMARASERLAATYKGRLEVVGVNLDSKALVSNLNQKVRAKAHDLGMSFPQAMDPLRYSRDAFGLRKTPGAILVSGGRIVGVFSFDHAQDSVLLDALVRKTLESRSRH